MSRRSAADEGTPPAPGGAAERGPLRQPAVRLPAVAVWLLALAAALLALVGPAAPGEAVAKPRKAKLDLRLERTPIIVRDAYRALPPMGKRGAMGSNLRGGPFDLADQQLGDYYVRAGIVHGRAKLIKRGLKAFNYAFARQRGDGSFSEVQAEAYAFFVEAVAHSGLLIRSTRYRKRFGRKVHRQARKLERAAAHMVAPFAWAGFKGRNPRYTHSGYSVGTALSLTAKLARNGRLAAYGRSAIRHALDNQWRNGVNPELGGYDVRYQMAGITYGERFRVYLPKKIRKRIERMNRRGLKWMKRRVAKNGYIRWRGSSRSCRELNSNGNPKTPGYSFAVRGFAYWGALKGRPRYIQIARRIDRYARLAGGDSLCDPKDRSIKPPKPKRKRRRGGGGGESGGGGGGGLLDRVLEPIRQDDLLD